MKKINSYLFAAVALCATISCQKEVANDFVAETNEVSIIAVSADTKTALVENVKTVWTPGDALTVFDAQGVNQKFETTITENAATAKFTSSAFAMPSDLQSAKVFAVYPYTEGATTDFATKVDGLEIPAEQTAVKSGFDSSATIAYAFDTYANMNTLQFNNAYGLFKFVVGDSGVTKVTIKANGGEKLAGSVILSVDGTLVAAENAVSEINLKGTFDKGATYYVAAIPGTFASGITVLYNGVAKKSWTSPVTLKKNVILDMGTLMTSEDWGICGTFTNNWDVANNKSMSLNREGWYELTGVEIYKDDQFKFVVNDDWTNSLGGKDAVLNAETGKEYALESNNSQNIAVTKNGVYSIYLNPTSKKFKLVCTEEYTDLQVKITIENKAAWSPLYLYLEAGGKAITPAEGVLVSNNEYSISGDYIGSSLTYQFISGSNKSEKASVNVARTGVKIALEATVIKLTFTLDTDNSRKWWGNTAKIHVWDTGTSFDTSWPGNEMTSDGNYTWHINVPAELVGKTIKYLIHNGNGWQSADSKVVIKADGVSVSGSSIGIK